MGWLSKDSRGGGREDDGDRLEKGHADGNAQNRSPSNEKEMEYENWRREVYNKAPVSEFGNRKGVSELEIFQTLVGIHFEKYGGGQMQNRQKPPASPWKDIFFPSKAARARFRNRGLYDRTLSQDMKNRVMYGLANYIISCLYLIQVIIAATITALAADEGRTSNTALTALGAVNTVLAGVLAWLTGQGMPVRFRRSRDKYREVVHAIENAERTFAEIDYIEWEEGTRPDPVKERNRLEKMYEDARLDHERNYPETQNDSGELQANNQKLETKLEKNMIQRNKREQELEILKDRSDKLESESKELNEVRVEREKLRTELDKAKENGKQFEEKALGAISGFKERVEKAGESSKDGSSDTKTDS
ncbi:hypothetical protein D0860_01534 [Hortaea werneckii]|uniref:SMODS and SLOG-associating 2TM effector domain-containing protein n=1 Tax=Hortaea werneckii TaxID=91943 RepID=A0A3M7HQF6_HORWE|nr:hypothetical protein KC351_g12364 [Hortaea werneckii]RMZ15611.1 hypothetical protein D0860_01534 [Hortaea werneckii]